MNMKLYGYFKSIIEQDACAVVICNLNHEIIYMNPAAIAKYGKSGGADLVGTSIFDCHNERSNEYIRKVVSWFLKSKDNNVIYTNHNEKENRDVYMVALRDDNKELIGYYEKHEYRNPENRKFYDMPE